MTRITFLSLLSLVTLALPTSCAGPGGQAPLSGVSGCAETSNTQPPDGCGLVCRAEMATTTGGAPRTTVWIEGKEARLLIDTGASVTLLSPKAVSRLGLGPVKPNTGKLVGVGGELSRGTVTLRSLAVGYAQRTDQFAAVAAFAFDSEPEHLDGMLGEDVLHHYELELDLPQRVIRLYAGRPCDGPLPGWRVAGEAVPFDRALPHHFVTFDVKVNGKLVRALLDSGADTTIVSRRLAIDLGVPARELDDDLTGKLVGIGPEHVTTRLHQFDSLDVAGQRVTPVEVAVLGRLPENVDVVVGADFLAKHKVWVSRATGQLHVASTW